jgi:hypothetical protein
MTVPVAERDPARSAAVLTKAVVRAAGSLGLAQRNMALVLGVSESSISRLARGRVIQPDTKEGELAVLFLRLYRSLDALMGGDETGAREWMHAMNHHLGGVPADLICGISGLVQVAQYLDAMRGKS